MKMKIQEGPIRKNLIGNYNRTYAIQEFALQFCKGTGIDYGFGDKISWPGGIEHILPGATGVDLGVKKNVSKETQKIDWIELDPTISHKCLYASDLDFIYSSHALEHISDWKETLLYWGDCLKDNGILFLYLPHYVIVEWRPKNYREHKWVPKVTELVDFLRSIGFEIVEALYGYDSEGSFYIVSKKEGINQ